MIVDTSAIIAIVRSEPEAEAILTLMENSSEALKMTAANWLEAAIVIDSARIPEFSAELDGLVSRLGIEVTDVTASQARIARGAYHTFGKGSGHPARLNFGDCFAYAAAAESGEALLYKGRDFTSTDIEGVTR